MSTFDTSNLANKLAQSQLTSSSKQTGQLMQNKAVEALNKRSSTTSVGQVTELAQRIQKGGLKAVDKNQIKNLAESKLAETIFKTGPKDDLLAVDVFGISDTGVLNNFVNKLSSYATGALESFRKNSGIFTDLTSMIRKDGSGFSFDTKSLTDRVMSSMGSSNAFRGLSDSLQKSLTQNFNLDPKIYSEIEGVIGGVARSYSSGNFKDARGIFDIVNQLAGNTTLTKFFDVGAEANLLSGLMREAIELGIPEIIDELRTNAKSSKAADYALRGNIEVAVSFGDLDTTDLMIDGLGVNRILADVPDAAERLVASYQIPTGMPDTQLNAEAAKLVATLASLDPLWATYSRNGVAVSDLTIYSKASDDAIKLLKRLPEHRIAATIARQRFPSGLLEQAKSFYPLAAI